jgi:hypothetical protein
MTDLFVQPITQFSFAGLSAVLLAILVWLIRRLLDAFEKNSLIIAQHLLATQQLTETVTQLLTLTRSLHDKLISRPCIAEKERL